MDFVFSHTYENRALNFLTYLLLDNRKIVQCWWFQLQRSSKKIFLSENSTNQLKITSLFNVEPDLLAWKLCKLSFCGSMKILSLSFSRPKFFAMNAIEIMQPDLEHLRGGVLKIYLLTLQCSVKQKPI
jgi:hypothetical protein